MKALLVLLSLIHFYKPYSSLAFDGRLKVLSKSDSKGENWVPNQPTIVFALALSSSKQNQYYEQVIHNFSQSLPLNFAKVKIINGSTGGKIVSELMDPNTVGLVMIGHTYQTKSTNSSVFVGSDFQPYPTELLSAATPALRFIAFLGCHAKGAIEQYQVKYTFGLLPGKQVAFYTNDSFLATNEFLIEDGVKHALKTLFSELQKIDFQSGVKPTEEDLQVVNLTISVKDVVEGLEPRYILVNHKIVGMLGDTNENSNLNSDYRNIQYNVPKRFLKISNCNQIGIYSAELSPGSISDDYMIHKISIDSVFNKTFDQPVHLGTSDESFSGEDPFPPQLGEDDDLNRTLLIQYALQFTKSHQWIDKNPKNWSPLSGRFFSECIYP